MGFRVESGGTRGAHRDQRERLPFCRGVQGAEVRGSPGQAVRSLGPHLGAGAGVGRGTREPPTAAWLIRPDGHFPWNRAAGSCSPVRPQGDWGQRAIPPRVCRVHPGARQDGVGARRDWSSAHSPPY